MLFSPTVSAAAGAVVAVVGVLTLRHQRKNSAWVKRMRRSDDDAQDLADAATYLRTLVEMLCDRTHKPCRAGDLESLRGLRHLLDDTAQATEAVRPELEAVVGCLDRYLATGLPPGPATGQVRGTELTAQLEAAMRQEHARIELKNAAGTAQRHIRTLRRAA
ncbi:hypothetical protein ACFWPQ_32535 [Streptomyces sp. NPDC058464]|uniref:hypothetical protein n=1 Tax=Streptomyces sp. NPDC058464 TaxID=3346511 RepID=UPI003663346C